jgi:UDP-N-acetylmuramate--alanine ligase
MLCRILTTAGVDPTVLNGAPLLQTGAVDRIGGHDFFAFEACEYMDSFLDFRPTVAVILNIELDHVDYFPSIERIRESFTKFASLTGPSGLAVLNADDVNCMLVRPDLACRSVTFSRKDARADYRAENEKAEGGFSSFDIVRASDGSRYGVELKIPGSHHVSNALAAFAASVESGVSPEAAAAGLSSYPGISRRMERISVTKAGAVVYSDYAHHPTEIAATLRAARDVCSGRLTVVFQPHTYSRTASLFEDFLTQLSRADVLLLAEIFAAREQNTIGISSKALADRVEGALFYPDFAQLEEALRHIARPGDIVLTVGAGDVYRVGEDLVALEA